MNRRRSSIWAVRPAEQHFLGSQGLSITMWVPSLIFFAVLIEYSLSIQKVGVMKHSMSLSEFLPSAVAVFAKVLTHVIAGALLI